MPIRPIPPAPTRTPYSAAARALDPYLERAGLPTLADRPATRYRTMTRAGAALRAAGFALVALLLLWPPSEGGQTPWGTIARAHALHARIPDAAFAVRDDPGRVSPALWRLERSAREARRLEREFGLSRRDVVLRRRPLVMVWVVALARLALIAGLLLASAAFARQARRADR